MPFPRYRRPSRLADPSRRQGVNRQADEHPEPPGFLLDIQNNFAPRALRSIVMRKFLPKDAK